LPVERIGRVREDYLLREQDFGLFTEIDDHAERENPRSGKDCVATVENSTPGRRMVQVAPMLHMAMRLFLQTTMHKALHGPDNV
jgi:2,3-bisphosphoglycerate-dependent phosphoglycerate mutase